jgi:hypothetical protein
MELFVGLIVEIFGNIFGRRVQRRKRLELVQHLVVDAVDDRSQHLLQKLEVEQQTAVIESRARECDAHFVIMAMRIFALSVVIAQVMPGRKACLNRDFVHRRLPDPVEKESLNRF